MTLCHSPDLKLGKRKVPTMTIKILVGSTSPHKIEAVRLACAQIGLVADVIGVNTDSHQYEQPLGIDSTFMGANIRAYFTLNDYPDCVCIGIESGIVCVGNYKHYLDIAYIVIARSNAEPIVATTPSIEFPSEYYDEARKRGFKDTTVGSVIAEKLGGDPTDPYAALTKGRVTRVDTLVAGLVPALKQLSL
jgi:non-canonical (house-cleaning) NTP pyrophosphatase